MTTTNSIGSSYPFVTNDIADGAVTYAKIQSVSGGKLLGNSTGSSATVEEVSIGSGLSLSGGVLSASGGGGGPWSSGTGTNSAIGGNGGCTASGPNSVCYGQDNSSTGGASATFGRDNTNSNYYTFVAGRDNTASADYCTRFGRYNYGSGIFSVAMGYNNAGSGNCAVAIGQSNNASGDTSWAHGWAAQATHNGAWVWSDNTVSNNGSWGANTFTITATGGYRYYQATTKILEIDSSGNHIICKGRAEQGVDDQAPSTGFNITVASGTSILRLIPSGTLATGTITLPSSPVNGQILQIYTNETITALTISANSGQSLGNGIITTLSAGRGVAYQYNLSNTTWYQMYA